MLFAPLVLLLATPSPAPAAVATMPPTKGPTVTLETSMGTIRIGLYPDKAPATVANFIAYVKKGHYDGTIFHRVISSFMIQGGGFDKDMKQKETAAPVKLEAKNGLHNLRGAVAMARTSDPDSATSQFFVNVVDNSSKLDPGAATGPDGYTVFGTVLSGMDVVDKIRAVATTSVGPYQDVPATPVIIKSAKLSDEAKPAVAKPPAPPAKPTAKPKS